MHYYPAAHAGRDIEDPSALSRRPPVPCDDRYAQIPVRRGRIPILRAALPRTDRTAQAGVVPAATADCAGLVDQAGPPPPPWPDTLDEWLLMCHAAGQTKSTAIPTQVRRGRLERATPRPLRRLGVSTAGGDQPERTGGGPHRRRVPARRAASARPIPRNRDPAAHGHGFLFATRERPVRSARGWSPAPVSMACRRCVPASASHSDWFSTTRRET